MHLYLSAQVFVVFVIVVVVFVVVVVIVIVVVVAAAAVFFCVRGVWELVYLCVHACVRVRACAFPVHVYPRFLEFDLSLLISNCRFTSFSIFLKKEEKHFVSKRAK